MRIAMRVGTRRLVEVLGVSIAVVLAACDTAPIATPERRISPRAASHTIEGSSAAGRYLVTFANDVPADFAGRVNALGGAVKYANAAAGIATVQGLSNDAADSLAASAGVSAVEADVVIRVDDGAQSQTIAAPDALAQRVSASPISPANPATAFFYGLGYQWNMQAIHADQAWAAGKVGSPEVTVAIIDTGIDYQSFDLAGLVDLSRSVSFVPSDDAMAAALFPGVHPSTDLNGHGTHVATQAVSNALAFAGVTSRSRLISVKVASIAGFAFLGDVAAGIAYAADHGADVANISLLGRLTKSVDRGVPGQFLNRVDEYAFKRGMLIVAGAGNDADDLDHDGNTAVAWCQLTHAVCVSGTGPLTPTGSPYEFSSFSNFGTSSITVAAPAGNYFGPLSNWPWGPGVASFIFALCSRTTVIVDANGNPIATPYTSGFWICGNVGTSLSTPHVTGLAALLVAEYGKVGPVALKNLITSGATDMGKPGRDPLYGWGEIDVARSLSK
jgi:subtilisin family serine protease